MTTNSAVFSSIPAAVIVSHLAFGTQSVRVCAAEPERLVWEQMPNLPDSLGVAGPFAENPASFKFLKDVWEFTPATQQWRQRKDAPRCVMAGTGIAAGQSHIFVLGGDTGELFFRGSELKDDHPGFVKKSLEYDTITDTWIEAGTTPANHVTTIAVRWGNEIIIPSGEVRPRVRSPKDLSSPRRQIKP